MLQLRIGTFIVIALLVFLGVIYLLGAQSRYFERKYELSRSSPRWAGSSRAPPCGWPACRSGGSPSVVLSPEVGGKVRVTLTVARGFSERIRRDSEAQIVTQGLLGDKLVEITQGRPEAPAAEAG